MFKKRLMSQTMLAVMLSMMLVGQPLLVGKALADGGDFQLDFIAAAPFTYDHTPPLGGGGTYDDRTIGKNKDVVESLEAGDFACGDLVSFFTQIVVDSQALVPQTIDLNYSWTADTTGQSGLALDTMVKAVINRPPNVNVILPGVAEGPGGSDSGNVEDGGSTATIVATDYTQDIFTKGAQHFATVRVTDLEAGEKVVLRFELNLACNGEKPSGNMQAKLESASVVAPVEEEDDVPGGAQTIPFKQVGAIKCPDPKFCQPPPPK